MSLQRLLSIILLFSYGIPASLGPFWHHHAPMRGFTCDHHRCGDGQEPKESSAATACSGHSHELRPCGCASRSGFSTQNSKQVVESTICLSSPELPCVDDTDDTYAEPYSPPSVAENYRCPGACVICAFYAQYHSNAVEAAGIASGTLIIWSIALSSAAKTHRSTGFSARGPPSLIQS